MRKLAFFFFLTIVFAGCSSEDKPLEKNGLRAFNEALGIEKSKALDKAVESFEDFLKVNFPNQQTYADQAFSFLLELDSACNEGASFYLDSSWTLNSENDKRLVALFENSGLRREIWLFGYEGYYPKHDLSDILDTNIIYLPLDSFSPATIRSDSELMEEARYFSKMEGYNYDTLLKSIKFKRERRKNSLYTNEYGDFIYGLLIHSKDSSYAKSIAEAYFKYDISPCVLIPSLIEFNKTKVDLTDPLIKRILTVELYYPIIYNNRLNQK